MPLLVHLDVYNLDLPIGTVSRNDGLWKRVDEQVVGASESTTDLLYNELMLTYEDAVNAPTPVNFGNGYYYTYQPAQDANILETGSANAGSAQNKAQRCRWDSHRSRIPD